MAARITNHRADIDVLLRTGPFHEALREAIRHSGLTLEGVRTRLAVRGIRVSLASLSHWQQGRSRPERADSLRAVVAIEHIVGLPRHSLAALLGPPRPRGRWLGRQRVGRRYDGILEPARALAQTIEPMLGPSDHRLRVLCQQDLVMVDADRAIRSVRTQTVVRAVEDDPDRHLAVYSAEPGNAPGELTAAARENCRLGRVRRHESAPVIAAELLFDQRLRTGDTHLFGYEMRIATPVTSEDYRRGFRYPADTYVLGVCFAEVALPVRCFALTQRGPAGAPVEGPELPVSSGRWVHRFADAVPPGVVGIGWEWE